jgi:pilus assembly protein CpaB
MNPRTLLLAVAALITAGGTAFLVQGWLDRQRAQINVVAAPVSAPVATGVDVLVAKKDLGSGNFVKAEHLKWQKWPKDGLTGSYVVKGKGNLTDFVGAVVRRGIVAGEPITNSRVVRPGERGFLAAVMIPGLRAVAVSVNAASAIAGLVFPGDRVDLILSLKYDVTTGTKGKKKIRYASETLLTNVRILAIDQSTDDKNTAKGAPKTATLEVSPKQAELVAVALNLGRLSLSLRSLTNEVANGWEAEEPILFDEILTERGTTITRDSDVSRVLRRGTGPRKIRVVNVLRGGKAEQSPIKRGL